jgi:hypothetical protein
VPSRGAPRPADLKRRAIVALDDARGSLVTGQTSEQLAYSTALIRQQAEQLKSALRPAGPSCVMVLRSVAP